MQMYIFLLLAVIGNMFGGTTKVAGKSFDAEESIECIHSKQANYSKIMEKLEKIHNAYPKEYDDLLSILNDIFNNKMKASGERYMPKECEELEPMAIITCTDNTDNQ